MKIFNTIREFLWPLLEDDVIEEPPITVSPETISVNDKYLEKTLEYAVNNYDSEMERKKAVESKASLFIGTISVVTSVIIGVTSVLLKTDEFGHAILPLVFLLFMLSLYMSRTVWFAVKALERGNYHTISIEDYLISDEGNVYYKKLISEITNKVVKNYATINNKVDNMTMAQEYFKRAIVVVVIYSFIIFIFLITKSSILHFSHLNSIINLLNGLNLVGWNAIIIYGLIGLSLVLGIIANLKTKKQK